MSQKLGLKTLTLKLMSLVTAQRGKSLHILDIDYMKEVNDGSEFLLTEHIKQSRPSYKALSVVLKAFPVDFSLCVVTYLREYLKRTKLKDQKLNFPLVVSNLTNRFRGKLFRDGSVQLWRLLL